MNKFKNQRGFATLEIILVVGIIAIFSTVALPRMRIILNKVYLDYEMKHLYSELNFARSIGKSSTFNSGIFQNFDNSGSGNIEFWLYSKYYSNKSARNRYQMMRPAVTSSPNYRHNLSNDIELEFEHGDSLLKLNLSNLGNSKTFTLNSKSGDNAYIYIDTVGRVSGDYVKRY